MALTEVVDPGDAGEGDGCRFLPNGSRNLLVEAVEGEGEEGYTVDRSPCAGEECDWTERAAPGWSVGLEGDDEADLSHPKYPEAVGEPETEESWSSEPLAELVSVVCFAFLENKPKNLGMWARSMVWQLSSPSLWVSLRTCGS